MLGEGIYDRFATERAMVTFDFEIEPQLSALFTKGMLSEPTEFRGRQIEFIPGRFQVGRSKNGGLKRRGLEALLAMVASIVEGEITR